MARFPAPTTAWPISTTCSQASTMKELHISTESSYVNRDAPLPSSADSKNRTTAASNRCGSSVSLAHQIPSKTFHHNRKGAMMEQKAPRGRPPIGTILVDGRWQLTEESLARAAARLEKHQKDCRDRCRRNRAALVRQRPDLFKYSPKPRMQELQATLDAPAMDP